MHGTLTGRKSPLELIEAFQKAFPTEQDVRLKLKTRLGILGFAQQTHIAQPADRRIKIIDADWLHPKLRAWLTNGVDVYVFPSKGEGYGMPPREALAVGCPVMFTNHTGMVDFADDRYNWPIPVAKEEESPLGGIWRLPDWDYVIETMRWMYHHREETYQKGYEGAKWFIENHGADTAARKLIALLETIDPDNVPKKTVVPAETIENEAYKDHKTFYQQLKGFLPKGRVIDVGVGEGVLSAYLCKQGYEVTGIVEPGKLDETAKKLKGLPVKLIEQPLWEVDKLNLEADACISQSVLQDYRRHEVELILKAMLGTAPLVLFSVPTVYYPKDFGAKARMRRRDRWHDMLEDFEYEAHYYGDKRRYLWVRVIALDQGMRATAARQNARKGDMIDEVWHPKPWMRDDGKVVKGEMM